MKDPLVDAGLRALREEAPSDESRRATLARLGLAEAVASAEERQEQRRVPRRPPLGWLLLGVLVGVLALVLQRWLTGS